jgi:hypothetical protein
MTEEETKSDTVTAKTTTEGIKEIRAMRTTDDTAVRHETRENLEDAETTEEEALAKTAMIEKAEIEKYMDDQVAVVISEETTDETADVREKIKSPAASRALESSEVMALGSMTDSLMKNLPALQLDRSEVQTANVHTMNFLGTHPDTMTSMTTHTLEIEMAMRSPENIKRATPSMHADEISMSELQRREAALMTGLDLLISTTEQNRFCEVQQR